jgi:hypothetical protein
MSKKLDAEETGRFLGEQVEPELGRLIMAGADRIAEALEESSCKTAICVFKVVISMGAKSLEAELASCIEPKVVKQRDKATIRPEDPDQGKLFNKDGFPASEQPQPEPSKKGRKKKQEPL